jgi:hypothetical protein
MRDVKKVSWSEFIKEFDVSVRDKIAAARRRPGIVGVACLVCEVLDSSRLGMKTALTYGAPDSTYKSVDDMLTRQGGIYTTGLPSSAAFPSMYTEDMPS